MKRMSSVATAAIVGEMFSRMPLNIWRGKVSCSGPARKSATTTSSNESANANSAPEMTPVGDLRAAGHLDVHVLENNFPDPETIMRVIRGLRAIS